MRRINLFAFIKQMSLTLPVGNIKKDGAEFNSRLSRFFSKIIFVKTNYFFKFYLLLPNVLELGVVYRRLFKFRSTFNVLY